MRSRASRAPKSACRHGHPYPESQRKGRSDCAVCHREDALRRNRAKGVKPRNKDSCPKGHPYPESKRPNGKGCAVCHREAQLRRYRGDPESHRRKASEYQKAQRSERNAYLVGWRKRNLDSYRAYGREQARLRRVDRDVDAYAYSEMLRRDPCAYCGGSGGHVDHIVAKKVGGGNEWWNLTAACQPCNSTKRTKPLLRFLAR